MNPYKRTDYADLEQAYQGLSVKDRQASEMGYDLRRAMKRKERKVKASLSLADWMATVRENQALGRQKQAGR